MKESRKIVSNLEMRIIYSSNSFLSFFTVDATLRPVASEMRLVGTTLQL